MPGAKKVSSVEDRNRLPTDVLSVLGNSSVDKMEDICTAHLKPKPAKAESAADKVSSLGKARRKSLQEMRHICNNAEVKINGESVFWFLTVSSSNKAFVS